MKIWNQARLASERPLPKPRNMMLGTVGAFFWEPRLNSRGRELMGDEACGDCGYLVCSCDALCTGEFSKCPCALCVAALGDVASRFVPAPEAAPTPGTFAWLKTLAPETRVRRPMWQTADHQTTAEVIAGVVGRNATAWATATDWELAP
jgi:hypothetical protein